jgi:hypothetical protein
MRIIGWITTIVVGLLVVAAIIEGPVRQSAESAAYHAKPTRGTTKKIGDASQCADPAACEAANKIAYANVGKEPIIVDLSWYKGGFGVVMVLNHVKIKNPASVPVSDFRIACEMLGPSGTRVSSVSTVLYETIGAGKTRTFRNVNVGFIHDQSARASCRVHLR